MEWRTLERAFDGIPSGVQVVAGNACGTPEMLLEALGEHAGRVGGITLTAGLLLGKASYADALRSGALRLKSWHIHGEQRALWREGLVEYLPVRLTDVVGGLLENVDVALVCLSEPDDSGMCSLGASTTYSRALISSARVVIAEISDKTPRTCGDSLIHVSDVDVAVRTDRPPSRYEAPSPDSESLAVARNVATLIPNRSTVQLGIGMIGEALGIELAGIAGSHSLGLLGMVTESMIPLVEEIQATGSGPVRAVEVMGGPDLMAWVDDNPAITMQSAAEVHNPLRLAEIPNFISINSAIAVDLAAQVVAETLRGRQVAGVGGSADFFEGAHLSPGGLRVIALRSTTRSGVSTIVSRHAVEDRVTVAHHGVDAVVTEHGIAWLKDRSQRERREALVAVAAPEHRPMLSTQLVTDPR